LTVTWKESVSHAGHYRIALAASESEFVEPKDLGVPSTLPSWDLADGIQDKTGTQTYSQSVQIPQVECPTCVLQLLQVMSAGTDGTNTGSFSGVYHACADVSIVTGAGDAGASPEVGAPDMRRTDLAAPDTSTIDLRASPDGLSTNDGLSVSTGGAGGGGTGGNAVTTMANGGGSGAVEAAGGKAGSGGSGGSTGASSIASSGGGGGSTVPRTEGSGGSPVAAAGGTSATASGGHGGSAAGGSGDTATSPSPRGCSCHMGSRGGSPSLLWLSLAALVTMLRRRGPRPN
jgi:MYXO-CTERM domain-containing protein